MQRPLPRHHAPHTQAATTHTHHRGPQVAGEVLSQSVSTQEPVPGFLHLAGTMVLKATLSQVEVAMGGSQRVLMLIQVRGQRGRLSWAALRLGREAGPSSACSAASARPRRSAQVTQQSLTEVEEDHPRMVEICNNHPMFQFLFDESGKLLTANKRAMSNLKGQAPPLVAAAAGRWPSPLPALRCFGAEAPRGTQRTQRHAQLAHGARPMPAMSGRGCLAPCCRGCARAPDTPPAARAPRNRRAPQVDRQL